MLLLSKRYFSFDVMKKPGEQRDVSPCTVKSFRYPRSFHHQENSRIQFMIQVLKTAPYDNQIRSHCGKWEEALRPPPLDLPRQQMHFTRRGTLAGRCSAARATVKRENCT